MAEQVDVDEAKTQLSRLLERVEAGDDEIEALFHAEPIESPGTA